MWAESTGLFLGLLLYYLLRDKLFQTKFKDFSNVRESRCDRVKNPVEILPIPRSERILKPKESERSKKDEDPLVQQEKDVVTAVKIESSHAVSDVENLKASLHSRSPGNFETSPTSAPTLDSTTTTPASESKPSDSSDSVTTTTGPGEKPVEPIGEKKKRKKSKKNKKQKKANPFQDVTIEKMTEKKEIPPGVAEEPKKTKDLKSSETKLTDGKPKKKRNKERKKSTSVNK